MSTDLQATRVDPASGIREIAEFTGNGRSKVFSFTHLPDSGAAASGVVICSPVYAEFTGNYRREVLVGRRLAALGIAVQRFHYRGQGNSGGGSTDTSFDSMVEDALVAAARLRALSGAEHLAYFGGRFGALIAASVASRDDSPVGFWDPVLEGPDYFRDVYRARRVQALKGGTAAPAASLSLVEQLDAHESVPVLGYTITKHLYESSRGRSLDGELGTIRRRVMILRMGRDLRNDKHLDELIERWRSSGIATDDYRLARPEAWWFSSGEATTVEAAEEARQLSSEWFASVLTHGRPLDPSGQQL